VEYIDSFAKTLPAGTPYEYLLYRLNNEALLSPRYFFCSIKEPKNIAECIDSIQGLSVVQKCILTAAPVDTRTETGKKVIKAFASCVANRKAVTIIDIPALPLDVLDQPLSGDRDYLVKLEVLHKSLILFLWLSYRFSNVFLDREMADHAKGLVEQKINSTLLEFSANPKLRHKLLQMRQAEHGKDNPDESGNGLHDEASEVTDSGLAEEDLTASLNDLPALSVDWQSRPSSDDGNSHAEAWDTRQPAPARP
jgi:ATP-dependent RNA helicase SUPV3L1/SUV3